MSRIWSDDLRRQADVLAVHGSTVLFVNILPLKVRFGKSRTASIHNAQVGGNGVKQFVLGYV